MTHILKQVIHYPDTNSVEATWVGEEGDIVRCHSYSDRQMDMFLVDLGADAAKPEYLALIDLVTLNQIPAPPAPPAPPLVCSPWQIRKALLLADPNVNLLDMVEAAVAASGDRVLKLGWEFATEFNESSPLVVGMATALGKTPEQMHDIFLLALAT